MDGIYKRLNEPKHLANISRPSGTCRPIDLRFLSQSNFVSIKIINKNYIIFQYVTLNNNFSKKLFNKQN